MNIGKAMGCALVGAGLVAGGGAIAQELDEATFALPQDVVASATAFEHYMTSVARIDSGFSSGASVARSLDAAAAFQPAQLEEGMIAYGAIAALQDDRFVEGVEQAAGRGEARAAFAERLIDDPYAATRVDGAEGAAERVEAALAAKSRPAVLAATLVNQAAYSVQHHAWSKVMVANAQGRLAQIKSLSAQRAAPSDGDNQAMMQTMAGADPRGAGDAPQAAFTAIEARSLALAAESVLGRAGGAERDRLSPLLTEADGAQCLKMAKLNLYQCMAVAGPQYEDIFCMGHHAMLETAQCVSHAAHDVGQTTAMASLSPRPQAVAVSLAAHRSLRIDP